MFVSKRHTEESEGSGISPEVDYLISALVLSSSLLV